MSGLLAGLPFHSDSTRRFDSATADAAGDRSVDWDGAKIRSKTATVAPLEIDAVASWHALLHADRQPQ